MDERVSKTSDKNESIMRLIALAVIIYSIMYNWIIAAFSKLKNKSKQAYIHTSKLNGETKTITSMFVNRLEISKRSNAG